MRQDYKHDTKLEKQDIKIDCIALDQSSSKTGYSMMYKGELISYGLIEPNRKDKIGDRIKRVIEVFNFMLDTYKPKKVALEDVFLRNNANTLINLSKLLGILEYSCYIRNIEYETIKPTVWKSYCGIKGRKSAEQKRNTKEFVEKTYGVKTTNDIADSIGINHYLNRR